MSTTLSRSTFWSRTFEYARRNGDWVRVPRTYTKATAQQIASDISNAHRRSMRTLRMRGIRPGEQWEARWEWAPEDIGGDFVVWIRLHAASASLAS